MNWKSIRLELARTPEFPKGSPSRVYLVRLPLDAEGRIDESSRVLDPSLATVRRFWPNQADMSGYVVRTPEGWAFSYAPEEEEDDQLFHLNTHVIRHGEHVTLTEPDGSRLPFRVASIERLGR